MSLTGHAAFNVWLCKPGKAPQRGTATDIPATLKADVPVWVDVKNINDPYQTGSALTALTSLHPSMVASLINPGWRPISDVNVRLISWARFTVSHDVPDKGPVTLAIAGLNVMRGPGWVMTFRQPAWGAGGAPSPAKLSEDDLLGALRRTWERTDATADDIATLWLHALAETFPEATSSLSRYLTNTDLARWDDRDFPVDPAALRQLAFCVDTLALQLRGYERPGVDPARAWFTPSIEPAVEATAAIRDLIAMCIPQLDGLRRDVRAVIDQARIERESRFNLAAGVLASVFVGPALVIAAFQVFPGWFSGRADSRLMALILIGSVLVAATALGLSALTAKGRADVWSPGTRSWCFFAAGVVVTVLVLILLPDGRPTTGPSAETRAIEDLTKVTRLESARHQEALQDLSAAQRRLARQLRALFRDRRRGG